MKINRETVLRYGILFLLVGIILMICDHPVVRILGSIEIFIGSLSLVVFNGEKYKYLKLLHHSLLYKGYEISFKRQRLTCIVLCIACFLSNSISWGILLHKNIISTWVFNVIGLVYILLLLPLARPTDDIEKQLAHDNAEQLIDLMKNHE